MWSTQLYIFLKMWLGFNPELHLDTLFPLTAIHNTKRHPMQQHRATAEIIMLWATACLPRGIPRSANYFNWVEVISRATSHLGPDQG